MRAALYARVSTHDQQTLGLQVEATAVYIKGRGWDLVRQVEGRRLRREGAAWPRGAAEGRGTARDRRRGGLATGPLGPLTTRPRGHTARADGTGRLASCP